jgi:hypothetical protein
MNDANDVNDVNDASAANAGMLIHPPGSSEDHGDFDPADSLQTKRSFGDQKIIRRRKVLSASSLALLGRC